MCRKFRPRKTQTARAYRKLRTQKNSDPLGVSKTQIRPLNWKLSQIPEKVRPSGCIEKSHPFILLNFRDFKALRSTVNVSLMANLGLSHVNNWGNREIENAFVHEMERNVYKGNGGCKYFFPGLSFRDFRWSWIEWSLSCLRCKHCYFIDTLSNNVIRSTFRIPRSVGRYVKLVFLFFDNEAKTLRNQNDVLTLEIIDRW